MHSEDENRLLLGWREWVSLPELGIPRIKAKVDTGARTSSLHAFAVEPFVERGGQMVRFSMHPMQRNTEKVIECVSEVIDQRVVSDSGGHKEQRWVIATPIEIGAATWPAELTLTSRDDMLFRMLLGRTAMAGLGIVDPALSYVQGKRRNSRKSGD